MASTNHPRVVHHSAEIYSLIQSARRAGKTVGIVPTMGALHEGHLSLVRAANERCDVSVATIFVNPTQFAPHEDFQKYPRTLDADVAMLAKCETDFVFAPASSEIYPAGFSTYVEPPAVAGPLEGVCRPGHFRGVTTVVLKLFNIAPADWAFFGRKDFQQALVIRRMAADLNLPVAIEVCPIIREADGLAMSSRNRYLNPAERQQALALSQGLRAASEAVKNGQRSGDAIRQLIHQTLLDAGISTIDYVAVADPETLVAVSEIRQPTVALIAAKVGTTRLIDNELLIPVGR